VAFTSDQEDELRSICNEQAFIDDVQEISDIVRLLPLGDYTKAKLIKERPNLKADISLLKQAQGILRSMPNASARLRPELIWREHRLEKIETTLSHRGPQYARRAHDAAHLLRAKFEEFDVSIDHTNAEGDFVTALGIVFWDADLDSSATYIAKRINQSGPQMPVPEVVAE
jgi:hypothetical protein